MRLVPNTDTVPASVNKYLLPHESRVITVHQHPAMLIKPIFFVLLGLSPTFRDNDAKARSGMSGHSEFTNRLSRTIF